MNLPDSPSITRAHPRVRDAQVGTVFGEYWTAGDGAAAAEEHYAAERATHQQLAEACRYIGRGYGRLGGYVRSIKRKIREAHDEAHRKIEEALRANKGLPVTVDVTPILTEYRGLIEGYSGELRTFVTDETAMLGNEFKLAPPGQDGGQGPEAGGSPQTTAPSQRKVPTAPTRPPREPGRGQRADTGRGATRPRWRWSGPRWRWSGPRNRHRPWTAARYADQPTV